MALPDCVALRLREYVAVALSVEDAEADADPVALWVAVAVSDTALGTSTESSHVLPDGHRVHARLLLAPVK